MRPFQTSTIFGALGKDPDIRSTTTGKKVASFSIAVDDSYTNQSGEKVERTDWIRIQAWGELAEIAEAYLQKGVMCLVRGKIKTRSWEADGVTKYITEVNAEQILPGYPKMRKGEAPAQQRSSQPSYQQRSAPAANPYPEDTLPF